MATPVALLDDVEEEAWIRFAAAGVAAGGNLEAVLSNADKLVEKLRERREEGDDELE